MKLKNLISESNIKEAKVINTKYMATKMVDLVFGNVGTEATPMYKDGEGTNQFREELISEIENAIKKVINNNRNYFTGDTKNVWKKF